VAKGVASCGVARAARNFNGVVILVLRADLLLNNGTGCLRVGDLAVRVRGFVAF